MRRYHNLSRQKEGPFVAINCGAIPEHLIESELFGYKKGAFTGAVTDRQGKFLLASHGTLFLDEVENMPLYLQQKLLRVLEMREIEPLGSARPVPVDLRIVAATNHPLRELVEQGRFREDLFHRLNVISLNIPPLRERGDDAVHLSEHLLRKYNREFHKNVLGFKEEVKQRFRTYPWRGNVRELQNTIEYAVCMCVGEWITENDLPDHMNESMGEAQQLLRALEHFGWSEEGRLKAAAQLGISRATLYRKIKKFKLREPW